MKKLILVLMLQSMVSVSPAHQIAKRMVNGTLAGRYQFPYMASFRTLDRQRSSRCGAVVIDPHWLLTAGHCLIIPSRRYKPQYNVHLGTTLKNSGERDVYNVEKIYLHPGFNETQELIHNDLALLYVANPIKYTKGVYSKPLGTVEDVDGVPLIAAGWGAEYYPGGTTNELHYIRMSTMNTKRCEALHATRGDLVDGRTQICAISPSKTPCAGDSGGPLLNTRTDRLVGIFSSMQYCESEFPALFVRISAFRDWIENVTNLHFPLK